MARAIERIEREIAALEESVSALAAELHSTYTSYLTALGQAVRQQLILASYQLCTQGYPQAFLSLSFNQRQQLQQAIRQIGQKASDQLLAQVSTEEEGAIFVERSASRLPTRGAREEEEEEEGARDVGRGAREEEEETREESEDFFPRPSPLAPRPSLSLGSSHPEELARWQQSLEKAIFSILRTTSRDTNLLLHRAGIIPKNLPEPLLEAATKAEASVEGTSGPPNLLNLLIEIENGAESEGSSVTNIIAIHLRLSEIEFADAIARAGRNQIRNLEVRAKSLGREHQKKQRERTVACAEAAWRSSWFDG